LIFQYKPAAVAISAGDDEPGFVCFLATCCRRVNRDYNAREFRDIAVGRPMRVFKALAVECEEDAFAAVEQRRYKAGDVD
jgi:hypothetical protein